MEKIILNENNNTFNIGGIEFIKFAEENGEVTAVAKDIVFRSEFGGNNNFAESKILERLEKEVLPKIIEAVGEENILEHEIDLTSLDGLKTYGNCYNLGKVMDKKINKILKGDRVEVVNRNEI